MGGENSILKKTLIGSIAIAGGAAIGVAVTLFVAMPKVPPTYTPSPLTEEEAQRRIALESYLATQTAAAANEPSREERQSALEAYLTR